ncbi:MAG: serine/threonine-protein kinase [Candidatus Micrarchaeota archaeon]
MTELRTGQLFAGRYSVDSKVGGGGFCSTYSAKDTRNGGQVALKVLHEDKVRESPKVTDTFLSSMKLWMSLKHRNIVAITDTGICDDGVFAVMELLTGRTLHEQLKSEGAIEWGQLKPLMAETCDALSVLHDTGLLHGDLKPAEIFVADSNEGAQVKLLDTPCARLVRADDTHLAREGVVVGTIGYVSPEQVLRAMGKADSFDHRIDLYALGVVMYRSLTGRTPFESKNSLDALIMRTKTVPRPPGELSIGLPASVDALIVRVLSIDPAQRPQTAKELKEEILRS